VTGPSRATAGGRAYLDLQGLARRDGRSTDELLALYALEGFLDRLAGSARASDFVLKGGALLAAYGTRRPTRDIDLSAQAVSNDVGEVVDQVREIVSLDRGDGLEYDHAGAKAESIRDEDQYSGVRVTMACGLARARLTFHVDVNVGDPVWPLPRPVEVPRLLGGSLTVLGYPLAMVLAEKIVTAADRGTTNTRWRDFADVYLLTRQHRLDGTEVARSVRVVAEHRGVDRFPLGDVLDGYADLAQTRWVAWVRKQRLGDRLPSDFQEVLTAVVAFADPILDGDAEGKRWNPAGSGWNECRTG
jgi:hypothetical protein